jgi:hypothetical protein
MPTNYSNPSEYEQSVYEFLLIRDAQINICFPIYEPIFANTSSFLSQTDRCFRRLFSGSSGKFVFLLRVFAVRAVLEERIKLVNWGITVQKYSSTAEICVITSLVIHSFIHSLSEYKRQTVIWCICTKCNIYFVTISFMWGWKWVC